MNETLVLLVLLVLDFLAPRSHEASTTHILAGRTVCMSALLVHFYNPIRDKDGLLNKFVAYADPPYCHCELEFDDGRSCAVYLAGAVHLKSRTFDPANYHTVTMPCTEQQHANALRLAEAVVAEGQVFSFRAMLGSRFTSIPLPDTRVYTCCSKLCAELLREAGLLPDTVIPARLTPSALYNTISSVKTVVCDSTVIDFRPV
jgi:hypothetical protein